MKRINFLKALGFATAAKAVSPLIETKEVIKVEYDSRGKWESNWEKTPQWKEKMKQLRTGTKHTQATKAKISQKLKGRRKTQQHIDKWRDSIKGFKHTEDTKRKRSVSLKGVGSRPVLQFDLEGKFVMEHESVIKAAESSATSHENIRRVALGKQKSAKGYLWKYKNSLPDKIA